MTTDRDLEELAAKAAGIATYRADNGRLLLRTGATWKPLDDSGYAFRLAFAIGIDIQYREMAVRISWRHLEATVSKSDGMEGLRRIIVLLAAEIGKAMP